MEEILLYWIDKYSAGHRTGTSHASKDGEIMLCGRKIEPMKWDGGYHSVLIYSPECKKCKSVLEKIEN